MRGRIISAPTPRLRTCRDCQLPRLPPACGRAPIVNFQLSIAPSPARRRSYPDCQLSIFNCQLPRLPPAADVPRLSIVNFQLSITPSPARRRTYPDCQLSIFNCQLPRPRPRRTYPDCQLSIFNCQLPRLPPAGGRTPIVNCQFQLSITINGGTDGDIHGKRQNRNGR